VLEGSLEGTKFSLNGDVSSLDFHLNSFGDLQVLLCRYELHEKYDYKY
jgi:hypothetical protein